MDILLVLVLLIAFIAGLLSTFRWLFHKVTTESIGWWDTASIVALPGFIRLIFKLIKGILGQESFLTSGPVAFTAYVVVLYIWLRSFHHVKPTHSWIIVACWLPTLLVTVILFLFSNPILFD